ncbi:XAC2610-related protein [Desulfovibrio litoralis]|uniref:Uncharacterized protein n=1 Tax=Desulfovibrio litoralis DSM 11393 TaxID=1121455 RepID=A0A1M7TK21_9BACT|nr:hypothetical protein [Desulfovibrio litoralis]SHN71102.1 hypothetical protein SAMN02745728_02142 [Desulfovibrio litoralis DSM 11393]
MIKHIFFVLFLLAFFLGTQARYALALSNTEYEELRKDTAFVNAETRLNTAWEKVQQLPSAVYSQVLKDQRLWLRNMRDFEAHKLEKFVSTTKAYTLVTLDRARYLEKEILHDTSHKNTEKNIYGGRKNITKDLYIRYTCIYSDDATPEKGYGDYAPDTVLIWLFEKKGGKEETSVQEINLANVSSNYEGWNWPGEVEFKDYNFDGYPDLSLPSTAGNVMRFSTVFLYNPEKRILERSSSFEELPCIDVDPKRKRIGGYCFHSSACENWIEEYKVIGFDTLEKTFAEGTECGPLDADPFYYLTYQAKYKNGKEISRTEEKHFDE